MQQQQEKSKWQSIGNVEVSGLIDLLLVGAVVVLIAVLLGACDTRSELKYSNPAHQVEFSLSSVPGDKSQALKPKTLPASPAVDSNGNPAVPGS